MMITTTTAYALASMAAYSGILAAGFAADGRHRTAGAFMAAACIFAAPSILLLLL